MEVTPRIWDTCAYVRGFSEPDVNERLAADIRRGRFMLCAIVAMELHAGTRDPATHRALHDLARHLAPLGLVCVPGLPDYQRVGLALARYAARHGAIDPRAHFRDALIALCAARRRAAIVTDDVRDLERWARWLGVRPAPRVVATEDA